ncbi:MAG: PAS domain-containing protein [Chitinophagaceae bacterium]|nr:PAS domain-containing protein [Chitinophagaceae bacterium]MBP6590310.1 PAS domain-containing protein [Chitinophagaceae bacterium]MBP8243776.1 PAS domain-containing protein [Chitinophagaceae bacterium]
MTASPAYDPMQGEYLRKDASFLNSLSVALLIVDADGIVISCNDDALQLLGGKKEVLLAKQLDQIVGRFPGNRKAASQMKQSVQKRIPFETELVFDNLEGELIWLRMTVRPYQSDRDSVGEMICLFSDISMQKQAEEKARQLSEMLAACKMEKAAAGEELEKIVFAASHDLQEPLRRISSFVQLLEKKFDEHQDEQSRKYINYIVDGSARMKKLILDLLEYAKVNGSQDSFRFTSLQSIAAAVHQSYNRQLQEAGATLEYQSLPVLYCDSHLITQLMERLVCNALKYRSEHPLQILISSKEEESQYCISITDNGIGINPDHREKIFDLFQKLHSKEVYSGTGLGLAICKKIVRIHQGRIGVDAGTAGGSRFWFTIPKFKNQGYEKL